MLLTIFDLIGRLHPALVHLPIGILLAALLLQAYSRKIKTPGFSNAVSILLFTGMIVSIISCISGYVLSLEGDYNEESVSLHMWMGIATAAVSVILFVLHRFGHGPVYKFTAWGLFALVMITGHLGGTLTHGSEYLTEPLAAEEVVPIRKPIADVQQALVYKDIVEPIFAGKCYSCHGKAKQKGKLQLHLPELIMKGGKNGEVIEAGNAASSELVKRVLLPMSDEHHMAPKDKPQLTADEKMLIGWWIDHGASFDKKVKDLPQPEQLKPAFIALSQPLTEPEPDVLNDEKVDRASSEAVEKLRSRGLLVLPLSAKTNFLEVGFINAKNISDKDVDLLLPIKAQLYSLKANDSSITDAGVAKIASLQQLRRLSLSSANVSDAGMAAIAQLKNLQSLNLSGTRVTIDGVKKLSGLKSLRSLYLFQTGVDRSRWTEIKTALPNVRIDSGGYLVPLLPVDTVIEKVKKM
ncbi:MAG: hypothetical protein H7Y27_11395 [Gemmatimonadaceae bacterium]|nr:hypothetical protein [Chitinophagaceae bacterium]